MPAIGRRVKKKHDNTVEDHEPFGPQNLFLLGHGLQHLPDVPHECRADNNGNGRKRRHPRSEQSRHNDRRGPGIAEFRQHPSYDLVRMLDQIGRFRVRGHAVAEGAQAEDARQGNPQQNRGRNHRKFHALCVINRVETDQASGFGDLLHPDGQSDPRDIRKGNKGAKRDQAVPHGFPCRSQMGGMNETVHDRANAAHVKKRHHDHQDRDKKHDDALQGIRPQDAVHPAHDRIHGGNADHEEGAPHIGNAQSGLQQMGAALGDSYHVPECGKQYDGRRKDPERL